ncbi:MAG: hypothetical protein FWD61_17580 [Phycisphaerales bacterium]|nr:hypothetical protein [Phycisphaerales bacterium]
MSAGLSSLSVPIAAQNSPKCSPPPAPTAKGEGGGGGGGDKDKYKSITRDQLIDYIDKSGGKDYSFTDAGRVLRVATVQDLAEQAKLDENKRKHIDLSRELVDRHSLPMKVIDVEHVLGGERILFYFTSEQRVDFRSLVRDLAHELHTRIELRQIGARDEARLVADYEKCGQHCCCKQFLKSLAPISMRAAKVQKATLDPTKISGRCGRLMCCLRYEDQLYEELRKKLPHRNTRVRTDKGDAWVVDGQILTQIVRCQYDDGKRESVPMDKILEFNRPKPLNADGRVMQTPNDFVPPPPASLPQGGSSPGTAVPGQPRGNGPRPPRPKSAPSQAPPQVPAAGLTDVITDTQGAAPAPPPALSPSSSEEIDERAITPSPPPPSPPPPFNKPPQQGPRSQGPSPRHFPKPTQRFAPSKGGPRGPQGFRPPPKQIPPPPPPPSTETPSA